MIQIQDIVTIKKWYEIKKILKANVSNSTEYRKNVFASKKRINKIILMDHGKPELSGRFSAFHSPHITI